MTGRDESTLRSVAETAGIGEVIDKRYRITGILGQGGMGNVYCAEHIRLRKQVALKLLHSEFTPTSEVGRRFEREAFAAARLRHPNCVGVSDFGELEDGTLYLVMEFVDGTSLEDMLERDGHLAPDRALRIARHVLRGLSHAHEAGIVHRDIKPANVILLEGDDDAEFARILDFGIAKLVGEAAVEEGGNKLTQAGVAFGTPLYLSPEQACGGRVDHRADLYSTSVMLFQMLVGKPPFDADEPLDVLMMHAMRETPRMADMAPDVAIPKDVEDMIRRGMEKKAHRRFADADEYIAAIDACLDRLSAPATLPVRAPTPLPVGPSRPGPVAPMSSVSGPAAPMPPMPSAQTSQISGGPGVVRATSSALGAMVRKLTEAQLPSVQSSAEVRAAVPRETPAAGTSELGRRAGWSRWLRNSPVALAIGGVLAVVLLIAMCSGGESDLSHYQKQLQESQSCAKRRRAVEKLRQLGDKRAIPALEEARKRRNNARCLARDAARAIEHLESL